MMTTSRSDTESADINAASTATTATTAAITDQQQQQPQQQQQQQQATIKENNNGKKSKGLELFNAIFKRVHEKYGEKRRGTAGVGGSEANDVEQARDGEEQHITIQAQIEQVPGQTNITDNESNNKNNKEDKQLVYAELILKPAAMGGANQVEDVKAPTTTAATTPITNSTTSTTTPTTAKNATEYAEIVYVQKPSAELNKQA